MRPYEMLARYYDQEWGRWGTQYVKLVSWITGTYEYPIKSVVDLACGIGTLLTELERNGYDVLGIDLSSDMIDRAKILNPDIDYIVGDMATVVIPNQVDLTICSFDSLNYLVDEGHLVRALNNIHRMLKPCGFFVFDINTPHLYEERHHGTIEREFSGARFQQILSYDRQQRLASTVFDFGEGRTEEHIQRAYRVQDMRDRLHAAGFDTLGTFENFDLTAASEASSKAIFLARSFGTTDAMRH